MRSEQPMESAYAKVNDGPRILGVVLGITIFAAITMVARLFVRIKLIRNVGWDCIVGACIIIPEVHYGAGRHIDQIADEDFKTAFRLNFITQPIYLIAICAVKQSVGFFLLRIAIVPFYRRSIQGIMAFMAFYTTGCFFIPMLWQVQLNRRQKSSVIGILGLGIFATAAAIVKISFLPNYGRTGDWLWDSRDITIWTVLETCVGIIAGNLPCLKPLFRTVLGSTYGRGSKGRTGGTGTTPRYLSRAYGVGTNAHSAKANGFTSLTSSKAGRPPHDPYEMTAMGFGEGESRAMSAASNREDGRSEKSSQGSVELLGTQGANLKLGGILKTTEVTQSHEDTRVASPLPRTAEQDIRPEKSVRNLV
ncbi:hypothetical protein SLS60_000938 [Paraconiothyrium brasiliense]|uniref:Rhodopsin domain-containing protein n=1 Tax=Paraconiothyrium brasiliense TaxID=300254 RepID=A0ABR3S7N3_9PLEO